jgi:carbon storage regulator
MRRSGLCGRDLRAPEVVNVYLCMSAVTPLRMLILCRQEGEQIVVPQCQLTITVVDIRGKRVRLGVSAPPDVVIDRAEVSQSRCPAGFQQPISATLENRKTPARVLLADSERYLLDMYREHLEGRGFNVMAVTTGLECVERLRDGAPDLLVLEPSVLWGRGDGVLAMMQEDPNIPRVPVIVLTYGCDRGLLYRLAPYPIDDYQIKPLSAKRLEQRIETVLASRRSLETLAGCQTR